MESVMLFLRSSPDIHRGGWPLLGLLLFWSTRHAR